MRVGMTLPVMEPDLWADGPATLEAWARAIDDGPFASLCFGERMAFDNPETLTLLGAVAAWTTRVRLVTTVVVPQLHDPVLLAKSLATGDQLAGGRLTVGVGVGGREEDYRAAGADPATQTIRGMAERVAVMRRVWAGEQVTEAVRPVGPPCVQDGRPGAARRHDGAADDPRRRRLGRRPGRRHARPRRGRRRRAVLARPRRLVRRRPRHPAADDVVLVRPRRRRRAPPARRCTATCATT